jgi:hypothetical protein
MSPQLQALYLLGTIAATATVARVGLEEKRTLIDWLAIGTIVLLLIEIISMIDTRF